MAWTADDIARIEKAIASGVLRVRFASGAETEYQSADEMLKARDRMKSEIAAAATTGEVGGFRFVTSKGLG